MEKTLTEIRVEMFKKLDEEYSDSGNPMIVDSCALVALSLLKEKEKEVEELKIKVQKWDELDEEISKFYQHENDEPESDGGLELIGEIAVKKFGYL